MLYFKRIVLIGSKELQLGAIRTYLENNYFAAIVWYEWREREQIEAELNAEDARCVLFIVVQRSPDNDLRGFERLHLNSTIFACRDVTGVVESQDWGYIPPFREKALRFQMATLNVAILKLDLERLHRSFDYKSLL